MSFSGSCILAGIGALSYKLDRRQVYRKYGVNGAESNDANSNFYVNEFNRYRTRIKKLLIIFFRDFFDNRSLLYPLNGFVFFTKHYREYFSISAPILVLYLIMYSLVSFAYWATITPMYTAGLIMFGPIGLAIAIIHTFLHTNALTMMFMRLSHLQKPVLNRYLMAKNLQTNLVNENLIKYYVPMNSSSYWYNYFPLKLTKYILGTITFLGLMGICAIPIVGPFAFHMLISPFISRIYVTNYLRIKNYNNLQRYDRFFDRLGKYSAFGLIAGQIETIPVLAGLAISTNTISAAQWANDQFEEHRG